MLTLSRITHKCFFVALWYAKCALASSTTDVNIIDATYGAGTGSFELGSFIPTVSYAMALAPGATSINGWTVGDGGVGWVNGWNPNKTGMLAPIYAVDDGAYAVSLQNMENGSIRTVIPTVAGDVYKLSFGAAGPPSYFFGSYGNIGTGVVSAGSLVKQTFTGEYSNPPYNTQWQRFTPFVFTFTALGPATTIEFTGQDPGAGPYHYGPIIDSVSVTAVPVPASVWLFGSALTGIVGLGRRRGVRP